MIKFMDEIVEIVEEFARIGVECMVFISGVLVKWFILLTTPAWILPYKAIRVVLEWRENCRHAKEVRENEIN